MPVLHTVPATNDGKPLKRNQFFAQKVVAISEYGKRKLQAAGVRDVEYIPTGIWFEDWRKLAGRADEFKAKLGLAGRKVVFFPGHYTKGMGADIMLEAIPMILKKVPDITFVFACRLRESADLQREAEVKQFFSLHKLSDRVVYYHTIENMGELVGASDIVALPLQTMREKVDIPTTLIEFMAAAKPVVISDLAPMNEILCPPGGANRDVGIATPVGNVVQFADAVIALMTDSHLRQQMGNRGQQLVDDHYNICRIAPRYEKIYTELVER